MPDGVQTPKVDRNLYGIKVTCTDLLTGDTDERVIEINDYMVIPTGDRYIDSTQVLDNGTHVVTIKRRP